MSCWKHSTLGNLITLKRGYDLPTSIRSAKGKIPVISSSGLTGYHDIAKVLAPGIVTGRYGTIGEVFFIDEDFWPLNTTLYVEDFKGNDPKFVYHYLQTIDFKKFSGKTGVPGVNRNELHKIPILLPPIAEQRKIAEILGTWDAAIAKAERLVEALKLRKKALMQRLLTGEVRFPGFEDEWEKTSLGNFLTESRLSGSNGKLAKKITVKLYGKGVVAKEESTEGSSDTRYYKRKAGQFIYSKLDFLNGAFGIIPEELDGYETTLDVPSFDVSDELSKMFLVEYVGREAFYKQQLGLARGGRKARRIPPNEFLNIPVYIPSIQEQNKVSDLIILLNKEIVLMKKLHQAYMDQKRGLMQRLLSGELRVSTEHQIEELLPA